MVNSTLPQWVRTKYDILWKAFREKGFTQDQVADLLKEKISEKQNMQGIPVLIAELRKAGWLEESLDPKDSRRRIYKIKSSSQVAEETIKRLSRSDIDVILKKAADLIRTRVDYKFILILLFLKRISDKWELEFEKAYKEALDDGFSETDAKREAKNETYHDFIIPEEYLWENIRKDVNKLPENFSKALKTLAEKNPDLKDILDTTDFIQFTTNRENAEILRQLVELFSQRKLHHVAPDVLGDAYEWILKYFAPQKAKEGEVYTPREVIRLIVEILNPQPKQSVYDPACASAGMLISAYQYVEESLGKKEAEKLFLFGQEANHKTLAFGKMNLYMHDIRNGQLMLGDTLLYPKYKVEDNVTKFDLVVANPPWNQDGYDENVIKKGEFWKKRYPYGFTTKQTADWMWIQHMIASAKDSTGKVGIIIDNGCLFRSGAEQAIRIKAINEDMVECVILLPVKLFYNTGAPGALLIFNKNKHNDRKGKILFINASNDFQQHPDFKKLNILNEENISKIKTAYDEFKDIKNFSKVVNLSKVEEKEYDLSVPLYVYPQEKTEDIDVHKEIEEIKTLQNEAARIETRLESEVKNLNYGRGGISHWKVKSVKDLGKVVTGKTPSTKEPEYWNGKYPFVTPTDLSGDVYVKTTERSVTEEGLSQSTPIPRDSVMVTCIASIGEVALANEKCITNQQINSIMCNEDTNPHFVYYSMIHYKNELKRRAGITTSPIIKKSSFEKFPVPMPSKKEQDKIAGILELIDKKIFIEKQITEKLDVIKQGLITNLLSGEASVKVK